MKFGPVRQDIRNARRFVGDFEMKWVPLREGVAGAAEIAAHELLEGWAVRRSEDVRPSVKFLGHWRREFSLPIHGNITITDEVGASLIVEFTGTATGLHLTRHEYSGIVEIELDGLSLGPVDLGGPWRQDDETLLTLTGLPNGDHRLRVSVIGRGADSQGTECVVRSVFLPRGSTVGGGSASMAHDAWQPLPDVLALHARKDCNVGDLMSTPSHYVSFLREAEPHDLHAWHPRYNLATTSRLAFTEAVTRRPLIVGGGGLLTPYFLPALEYINHSAQRPVILWGVGHNYPNRSTWRADFDSPAFSVSSFALVGVRDWNTRFRWVPCASCLSPLFDVPREPVRRIGFFLHANEPAELGYFSRKYPASDIMTNFGDFAETLDFIGTSEAIVTNSFHGAYWATLLKRRVVALPTSSKFFSMRHPVLVGSRRNWPDLVGDAPIHERALAECRSANVDFAADAYRVLASAG